MNRFDSGILLWLNHFAGRSRIFDSAVVFLDGSTLLRGQAFILALWWFWFSPEPRRRKNREIILATLTAAFAAVFLGRALAAFLPFRVRPAFNPELGFVSSAAPGLRLWSAFPSDHAMVFSALSMGLFFLSRTVGAAAFAYSLVVVCLPRVYLGLHHPSDILGGMAIGAAVSCGCNADRVRVPISAPLLQSLRESERIFYMCFLFILIEVMTMFTDLRGLAGGIFHVLKGAR